MNLWRMRNLIVGGLANLVELKDLAELLRLKLFWPRGLLTSDDECLGRPFAKVESSGLLKWQSPSDWRSPTLL